MSDFFSELTREPLRALAQAGLSAIHHAGEHWWSILLVLGLYGGIRHLLKREREVAGQRQTQGRVSRRRFARRSMIASLASSSATLIALCLVAGLLGLSLSTQTVTWILGSVSLTVAFIVRPYLADATAGFVHLAQDAYGMGDYVDAGMGMEGTVININLLTTRLRDADGTVWEVHNSDLTKFGNRTKSTGRLLTDVTLLPASGQSITSDRLDEWEAIIASTLIHLRSTLRTVDALARDESVHDPDLDALASTVPALVPHMPADTLAQLRDLGPDDSGALPVVRDALEHSPAGAIPLFRDIEVLGLVSADRESVTVRIRVILIDQRTRTPALAALRRTLFDAFAPHDVATRFTDVPDGELLS